MSEVLGQATFFKSCPHINYIKVVKKIGMLRPTDYTCTDCGAVKKTI